MAATQQKKTTASKTKKGSGTQRKSTKRQEPAVRPIRREVGAGICLLLAFFSAIGYFNMDGIFINLFRNVLCGLMGYGFWFMPPMLLVCAYILGFHRGRPVRVRVWCALLFPVVMGAVLHLFLGKETYELGWEMFSNLWNSGLTLTSGGALSGFLAVGFVLVFSKVGAAAVFLVACLCLLLGAFNRTIVDVVDEARRRARERPAYELEEEPDPEPVPKRGRREQEEQPHRSAARGKRLPADIPVEDGPLLNRNQPTQPVTTVRKKKLFDTVSHTPAPDEVLTGKFKTPMESEPPEYEDVPEILPVAEEPEAAPAPTPVPTPEEEPPMAVPEIVREPAVQKVKPEEAARAAAQVTQEIEHAMSQADRPAYRYPPLSLLQEGSGASDGDNRSELAANQARLADAIQSFGVEAHIVNVTRGPSVTRYELELEQGVKLNKITNLADDIALALGASAVRIAPIPDKISTVGIEVPNKQVTPVPIHDVIGSKAFTDSPSKVSFAVGKDISGNCIVGNIAKLPHMLIAGTTGSGKSVCTNSLIISLLYKATPEEVRLIMVDPKMVELGMYNGIPHLLIPVVTDPKKAAGALQWAVNEMMKRYRMFSEIGAKDLASYNNHARKRDDLETLPQIVVVIDELADLMLVAAKEVEESICRVAQMGRAAGMHLVIATQRPSADVITGLMKANIPSRIAFAVASSLESRIILDTTGAEKLVGKGDMLYFPLGSGKPQRIQGCFISEEEVAEVVGFIKENGSAQYDEAVLHEIEQHAEEKEKSAKGVGGTSGDEGDYDELLPAAIDVVLEVGQASVSMLQRRLKLGYGRAARLVDQMEEKGIVGPFEGSKPRQLLITKEQWQEMQFRQNMAGGVQEPPAMEPPLPEGDLEGQEDDEPPFEIDG